MTLLNHRSIYRHLLNGSYLLYICPYCSSIGLVTKNSNAFVYKITCPLSYFNAFVIRRYISQIWHMWGLLYVTCHWRSSHYAVTHVRNERNVNSKIQGRSPNIVKLILNTIRNWSYRKEFAPSKRKFFPLIEVPISKKGRNWREPQLDPVFSLWCV